MAKTETAVCIDSSGIERNYKRAWLDKQTWCFRGSDGIYRALLHAQENGGASAEIPQGMAARMTLLPVQLRPDEPTPASSGDFLTYPFPSDRSDAPLRLRFPTLARQGAGL